MKRLAKVVVIALLALCLDSAKATEFMKQAQALTKALGASKGISKKSISLSGALDRSIASSETAEVYALKEGSGVKKIAVVQKRVYEPNCTHTWVVGVNPKSLKVENVNVVEMSCPHAFPCKEVSYLEQYKGVGPADLKKLKGKVDTIAKATGTSNLTTDAVITAVTAAKLYMADQG